MTGSNLDGLLDGSLKAVDNLGRVLEIEGLDDLTVEQAFELSDASAERSAAGCTIALSEESIAEYLRSNITLLRWMVGEGYGDPRTLERRAQKMEAWLAQPELMKADADAQYAAVIEIDLAEIIRAGHRLVITHGNGPQVGLLALQSAAGSNLAFLRDRVLFRDDELHPGDIPDPHEITGAPLEDDNVLHILGVVELADGEDVLLAGGGLHGTAGGAYVA